MRRNALLFAPLLILAVILQTTIISRVKLLEGNADLIMLLLAAWVIQEQTKGSWVWGLLASLFVGVVSGIPWYIYTVGYLIVVGFAQLVKRRIWEAPLLAMFIISAIGTFSVLLLSFLQISLFSTALSINVVFGEIILPSLLLNLLISIPVYAIVSSFVKRLLPHEAIG